MLFQIPEKTINNILANLSQQSYIKVAPLIKEIEATVKPLKEGADEQLPGDESLVQETNTPEPSEPSAEDATVDQINEKDII